MIWAFFLDLYEKMFFLNLTETWYPLNTLVTSLWRSFMLTYLQTIVSHLLINIVIFVIIWSSR